MNWRDWLIPWNKLTCPHCGKPARCEDDFQTVMFECGACQTLRMRLEGKGEVILPETVNEQVQ